MLTSLPMSVVLMTRDTLNISGCRHIFFSSIGTFFDCHTVMEIRNRSDTANDFVALIAGACKGTH